MTTGGGSEWVYRLLLRGLPRHFRARFGPDLLEVFREQRREPEYRGGLGSVRFWRDIGVDWLKTMVAARRSAGGVRGWSSPREVGVDGTWEGTMDEIGRDFAFAVRGLWRAPGFAAVAVVTLALGIGSNAAIFGVVKSVLMEPLPYGEPDEVVTIWSSWTGFPKTWVSENEYRLYLTGTRSFEDLAIWNENDVTFTDPERPERVLGAGVTPNLVDVLGVDMAAGRFFTEEEAMRADSLPSETIVVSYEAWQRRWAGAPSLVGRSVEMNGRLRQVIGVLPEGFRLPTQFGSFQVADVFYPRYVPRSMVESFPEGGGSHGSFVVGRLVAGATAESARSDIEAAIDRVRSDFSAYPAERAFAPLLFTVQDDVFGAIRPALVALLAAVGFVLLIACANVANLLLARGDERAGEFAVRTALGAGRKRLVRQLLVESLVLAVVGGLGGVALAVGGVELFKSLNPGNLPRIDAVELDGGVLLFVVAVTVGTAFLFGILPALGAARSGLHDRMGGRGEVGSGRPGWQGALVVTELALAVALVVGAGLMARTFDELTSIEPGFEAGRTVTMAVSLPTTRYPDAAASVDFYRELLRRVDELPGVESASAIRSLPLASQIGDWGLDVEGYDESVHPRAAGDWQIASPGYFATIGIPMVDGRDFTWSDDAEARSVGIVNEAFVRRYWPDQNPIGRTFAMGGGPETTVVGVAGDVRHNGLTAEIKPKFYIPVTQWSVVTGGNPTSMKIVARAEGEPAAVLSPARSVVRDLDPSLAVAEVYTIDEVLTAAVAQPRFLVTLMGVFSGIALLLAVVGVYGVVSYGVRKRVREIGIRIALGAGQNEVVSLMLRRGTTMIVMGVAAGLALSLLMGRFLGSLLYGVTPTDPMTYALVSCTCVGVAILATWVPSRRAARVDPIRALKMD